MSLGRVWDRAFTEIPRVLKVDSCYYLHGFRGDSHYRQFTAPSWQQLPTQPSELLAKREQTAFTILK
jgi:hypothetical protein